MIKNGRQTAPTLDGIREDHLRRYSLAIEIFENTVVRFCGWDGSQPVPDWANRIVDVGTGTGYGACWMAREGAIVTAYEIDQSAIYYGNLHYSHERLTRIQADIADLDLPEEVGILTAFEIIEHTTAAPDFLRRAAGKARILVASVPNEEVVPFETSKHRQHVRHYTPDEFREMLEACGWRVYQFGCQTGKRGDEAEIRWDTTHGRTLIAVATSV